MSTADDTTPVEHREIPECPGYRFDSNGVIWSQWGSGNRSPVGQWKPMRLTTRKSGHKSLSIKIGGKGTVAYAHTMIAWAFHGPCPEGHECCHTDGNPGNNRPENLRWGTRQENIDDQKRHGVMVRGEQVGLAKLTENQVRQIRTLRATEGYTFRKLGSMFGVTHCTIRQVVDRSTWSHIS